MKKVLISLLVSLVLVLVGCSAMTQQLEQVVGNDLTRTSELAAAYGNPEVKQCSDFLLTALNSQDATQAKIDQLLAEKTSGLISAGFKAFLLAQLIKSLNDPTAQAVIEKGFTDNCAKVAGTLFITVARDARKAAMRKVGP